MSPALAWLDTSAEEQRQARELIALFEQPDGRDELGLSQIRDFFANALFPGTSVVQTRARYFLFVPWIYRRGLDLRHTGASLEAWADLQERRLIEVLQSAGHTDGLIGGVSGIRVQRLPSAIYWSGLTRYGILTRDVPAGRLTRPNRISVPDADDLAVRTGSDWNPTLPPAPEGFPGLVPDGFGLTREEASWLTEQIVRTCQGTLLAHLLTAEIPPNRNSAFPWEDPAAMAAPQAAAALLEHANLFSLCFHGAALLYNLLLGERYEALGFTSVADPQARYREQLTNWTSRCDAAGERLRRWDYEAMLALALRDNPRISWPTRQFVREWAAITVGGYRQAVDDEGLRKMIAARERLKGPKSRLLNDRLLGSWGGASGSAQLSFRWPQVQRIVADIRVGAGLP